MERNHKTLGTAAALAAGAAATALVLAGCASSGGSGTAAAAPAHHTQSSAAAQVRVGTQGGHLTDASGKSLYMFDSDHPSASTCVTACATYWPPLTAQGGAVSIGGAAKRADLGTLRRADGTMQVTYAGHPLYYYVGDTKAGDTNGQGLDDFGAHWWLLTPSGTALSRSSSGGASQSTSGAGGGSW